MGHVQSFIGLYEQNLRRRTRRKYFEQSDASKIETDVLWQARDLTEEELAAVENLLENERISERRKGLVFLVMALALILAAWIQFF